VGGCQSHPLFTSLPSVLVTRPPIGDGRGLFHAGFYVLDLPVGASPFIVALPLWGALSRAAFHPYFSSLYQKLPLVRFIFYFVWCTHFRGPPPFPPLIHMLLRGEFCGDRLVKLKFPRFFPLKAPFQACLTGLLFGEFSFNQVRFCSFCLIWRFAPIFQVSLPFWLVAFDCKPFSPQGLAPPLHGPF